jgi:hypothetical protein
MAEKPDKSNRLKRGWRRAAMICAGEVIVVITPQL